MSLKYSVVSSLIWKFLERIGSRGAQFIAAIVLVLLLPPADFGLIALAIVFVTIANIFEQRCLNAALIQKKNANNLDCLFVFYSYLILAAALYLGLFFGAPLIGISFMGCAYV